VAGYNGLQAHEPDADLHSSSKVDEHINNCSLVCMPAPWILSIALSNVTVTILIVTSAINIIVIFYDRKDKNDSIISTSAEIILHNL